MGYYSSVAIEITKEEEPKFLEMIENTHEIEDYEHKMINPAKRLLEYAVRSKHKDYLWNKDLRTRKEIDVVVYEWEDVKWYYEGAHAIDSYLKELDNYGFARVGEETGDCEVKYEGFLDETLLRINSYISIG